jgi:GT2 family glycosyltransferase
VRTALASIADDDFDDIVVVDMASDPPVGAIDGARVIRSDVNAGVAAGRNIAAREARASLLVFLDDDAIFLTDRVANTVRRLFDERPLAGALAFRIVRPGGTTASHEHPFRGRAARASEPRDCAYFVGAAFAVRTVAFQVVGGFDEGFFYSTEEVELALDLVRAGWQLRYEPGIVAEHRPSPRGREIEPTVPVMRIRNRIVMARRHLPAPIAAIHVLVWSVRTANEARRAGSLRQWPHGVRQGLRTPAKRAPMSWRMALQLHRVGGRVLW